ncbi:MAG: cation transporter [Ignavibacteriae bacterium]|nr:MAG: cation transporter [Ignavibacteriota bacterium]
MESKDISLKKKAALISLIIGFLMFTGKMGAYLLTNSAAILSDALESVVHVIATSFAFYSLYLSLRPPDKKYPYGYGKIEYFSAGFEGALIIIAALSILYYAIHDIIAGSNIKEVDIGAIVVFIASAVNVILGLYLIRSGKKTKSIILIADGKHVLTDAYTSIGAFIALLLVLFTNNTLFDPIVAIILALNIIWTGKRLVHESVLGLMNITEDSLLDDIANRLETERHSHLKWIDMHMFRYWKSGGKYYTDFHLTVPNYMSVTEGHQTAHDIEDIFKEVFHTESVEALVHLDPCKPECCKLCRMEECEIRTEKFSGALLWTDKKIADKAPYLVEETRYD